MTEHSGAVGPLTTYRKVNLCVYLSLLVPLVFCHGCSLHIGWNAVEGIDSEIVSYPDSQVMIARDGQRMSPDTILSVFAVKNYHSDTQPETEHLLLSVRSSVNAYIRCYIRTDSSEIYRIKIESTLKNSYLSAGQSHAVPVPALKFSPVASLDDAASLLCLASSEKLEKDWAGASSANHDDGSTLKSFDQIYDAYRQTTQGNLIGRTVELIPSSQQTD